MVFQLDNEAQPHWSKFNYTHVRISWTEGLAMFLLRLTARHGRSLCLKGLVDNSLRRPAIERTRTRRGQVTTSHLAKYVANVSWCFKGTRDALEDDKKDQGV